MLALHRQSTCQIRTEFRPKFDGSVLHFASLFLCLHFSASRSYPGLRSQPPETKIESYGTTAPTSKVLPMFAPPIHTYREVYRDCQGPTHKSKVHQGSSTHGTCKDDRPGTWLKHNLHRGFERDECDWSRLPTSERLLRIWQALSRSVEVRSCGGGSLMLGLLRRLDVES